jgi:DNA-binding transcriptional ArsR family regulator
MPPDRLDALFHALSDPTRRAMVSRLMEGPATVTDLAAPFPVSMPTVLAHLSRLEAAGVVRSTKTGRIRVCRANPVALAPVRHWISDQSAAWEARVAAAPRRFRQASEQ